MGGGFLWGAHHPHCDRHHNHLIWLFGHPVCLGCTCMYSGTALGLAFSLIIEWSTVSFTLWMLLHFLILMPTFVQPWFQWKPYKIVARLLLGMGISTYLITGLILITPPFSVWIFRLTLLVVFGLLYYSLRAIRNRYTYNPCDDCPLGVFPTCDWNLPRLLRENPDVELLATINQSIQNTPENF